MMEPGHKLKVNGGVLSFIFDVSNYKQIYSFQRILLRVSNPLAASGRDVTQKVKADEITDTYTEPRPTKNTYQVSLPFTTKQINRTDTWTGSTINKLNLFSLQFKHCVLSEPDLEYFVPRAEQNKKAPRDLIRHSKAKKEQETEPFKSCYLFLMFFIHFHFYFVHVCSFGKSFLRMFVSDSHQTRLSYLSRF